MNLIRTTDGTAPQEQARNRRPMPPVHSRFKPGQSGNPSGRPRGHSITAELRKMLDRGLGGKDLAEAMARIAYQRALKGDWKFWNSIIERTDGKVSDRVESDGVVKVIVQYLDESAHADDTTGKDDLRGPLE